MDGGQGALPVACTCTLGENIERNAVDLTEAERLGDGKGPIDEVRAGRQDLDGDALLCQLAQREHHLEACEACPGDEDAAAHAGSTIARLAP